MGNREALHERKRSTIKSSLRQDLSVLDATDRIPVRTLVAADVHARVTTAEVEEARVVVVIVARARRPVEAAVTTIAGIAIVVFAITGSREKYPRNFVCI